MTRVPVTVLIAWLTPHSPIVQNNNVTRVMWTLESHCFCPKLKFCLYSPVINQYGHKGARCVGLKSQIEGRVGRGGGGSSFFFFFFFCTLSVRRAISALLVSVMDQRSTLQVSSSSLMVTQSMGSDKWKCTAGPHLSSLRLYNRDATQG